MESCAAVDRSLVDRLCAYARRGACTDAERRAAAMLHDELRARGHEAWVEARWTRPQSDASLLLHAGLAVIASLVSVALTVPAAVAAGVAAVSLAVEAAGWTGPLRLLFPRRATQHVLTVPGGEGVALIVAAGYDAPRGGLARSARARRLAARLPLRPLTWLAGCAVLVAALAAARAAGMSGAWLGAVQLVPTLVLLGAVAAGIDGLSAGWSRGAGAASAVAVAVALHEELSRHAPGAIRPALLLHGAAAPGPQARRAHLRGERLRPREAVLLEIVPSGSGAAGWAARHSQLRAAGRRATEALGAADRGLRPPAGTGRHPAIAVGATGPDTGAVDPAALDAALDLALAVVDALDAELTASTRVDRAGGVNVS
jgi:hypothetical protein